MSVRSLERVLLYLTIIAGFIGSGFLAIEVGSIHLFPYRFFLPLLWVLFAQSVLLNQGRVNVSRIKVKAYLCFLALWLIYAIFSLAWAASKIDAIRDIIFLSMAVSVIFFTIYYVNELGYLKQFYYLWLVMSAVLVLIGIWEITTGRHLAVSVLAQTLDPRVQFMPTAVFRNPNDYATYLALSIPFVLVWIRYSSGVFRRLLGVILLIASLYVLVATTSRANYLAVFVGSVFWFLFMLKFKGKFRVVTLVVSSVLALLITFPNEVQSVFTTVSIHLDIWGDYLSQVASSSINVRLNLIKNALTFLVNSLGFGVGAGNVRYYMAEFPVYATYERVNVHNWWIEVLTNYGLFIFVAYVIFFIHLILEIYRNYRKLTNTTEKMIGEGLLMALVCFFLASISPSSVMAFRPQWMLFAFALSFLNYSRVKGAVS